MCAVTKPPFCPHLIFVQNEVINVFDPWSYLPGAMRIVQGLLLQAVVVISGCLFYLFCQPTMSFLDATYLTLQVMAVDATENMGWARWSYLRICGLRISLIGSCPTDIQEVHDF